jgi:hypothetical protein
MYKITQYTKNKAKDYNVVVKPSTVEGKKVDVFNKKGEKLASIGAIGYGDYPTYLKEKGVKYAQERRRLYKIRHENDRHKRGSAGYYADKLLW